MTARMKKHQGTWKLCKKRRRALDEDSQSSKGPRYRTGFCSEEPARSENIERHETGDGCRERGLIVDQLSDTTDGR